MRRRRRKVYGRRMRRRRKVYSKDRC